MSPDCGTQNITCSSVEPRKRSLSRGPGTLVITAVVLLPNRPMIASCAGLASRPATARTANASRGCVLPLSAFIRRRTS
jgi:hypothetical protein